MNEVTSRDGTTIAFDRLGEGPPVVLVCGGSTDRMANAPLAELLAQHFTVLNYDRRGRGDSGDTPPYAVEREVEDIEAVIGEAGGSAFLYGTSSGAALALEAAASGLPITKLALWEPPFILDESRRPPADQVAQYDRMIAEGRRGDAAEYFMTAAYVLPDSPAGRRGLLGAGASFAALKQNDAAEVVYRKLLAQTGVPAELADTARKGLKDIGR